MHKFLALAGVCMLVAGCSGSDKPTTQGAAALATQPCVVVYKNRKGQTIRTTSSNGTAAQPCTTVLYMATADSVVPDTTRGLVSVGTEGSAGHITSFVPGSGGATQAGKTK